MTSKKQAEDHDIVHKNGQFVLVDGKGKALLVTDSPMNARKWLRRQQANAKGGKR